MRRSRLALGGAQLGMSYGIKNTSGQVSESELKLMLDLANVSGLDTIDTAYSYGTSENAIGNAMKISGKSFNIVSKFPKLESECVGKYLETSLNRLGLTRIYAYLYHDFASYQENKKSYAELVAAKKSGLVEKIGFSLYKPTELDFLLEHKVSFDILQIPLNVLDRRFLPWLKILADQNCEVHVRSIFLQGLLLMDPDKLPLELERAKPILRMLREKALSSNLPLVCYLLAYPASLPEISRIIVGVDGLNDLEANLKYELQASDHNELDFEGLGIEDEGILLPMNWRKGKK